jgi:glutamate-1-semialdehyde 2,1-aminomutase
MSTHFPYDLSKNTERYDRAQRVLPGGVNSPVRAFKGVGGTPVFMSRGEGAYLIDADNHHYLDLIGSWGPLILGHNHPAVVHALHEQLWKGTSFGAPTELETDLAEEMIQRVSGLEMVRLVSSGTEATMSAIRLARGFTNRDIMIKFIGHYHGHGDSFLIQAGSGLATFGTPSSPGVTKGTSQDTITLQFNDADALKKIFQEKGKEIAALILEPVAGNMGCIPPQEGFLQLIRDLCSENGSILIFDEVMTGFRLARGGAAERFGIQPDLYTFGKVIGGGMPVGAYGGKRQIMEKISPSGPIYQAGTLSGNPLAVVAGLTVLEHLTADVYEHLENLGSRMEKGLKEIVQDLKTTWSVQRVGSMLTLFFTKDGKTPLNFAQVQATDIASFNKYFHEMLVSGFYLPPSAYEAFFLNNAMTFDDVDKFIARSEVALSKLVGK